MGALQSSNCSSAASDGGSSSSSSSIRRRVTVQTDTDHLPPIWVILGPPGSGKGTYADWLKKRFHLVHLSTGDLAREAAQDPANEELRRIMNAGELLPDSLIIDLLQQRLVKLSAVSRAAGGQRPVTTALLLDGFPRTETQAQLLDEALQPVSLAVRIHLADKHILAKLRGRRMCKECGNGFNTVGIDEDGVVMPPILPEGTTQAQIEADATGVEPLRCTCGGLLGRRKDDDPAVAAFRLEKHHATEGPVVEFYKKQGVLLEHHVKRGLEDMEGLAKVMEGYLQQRARDATAAAVALTGQAQLRSKL